MDRKRILYNLGMTTAEIRAKYLKFFIGKPRNHKEISPAPLVPENDPTTLFTSSGMQQLVPYLTGENHPEGKRLVDVQPSIRLQDIDEVGDNRHTTFFEMLGNWSLGDYFKAEQLPWVWEFFTKELGLDGNRLYVSCFEGNKEVPRDTESAKIWKKIRVPEDHIFFYGVKENWWSRSGPPNKMPVGEIGGPDSEIFYEFTQVKHDPKFGEKCHPNCECGRFLEIGNSVFIQYHKTKEGLKELSQKNVDFGGGLERIAAAMNDDPDVFKIDAFVLLIKKISSVTGKAYKRNETSMRIIADHMRAANMIIREGVEPSNKQQGYVLRRLIRRSALKVRDLKGKLVGGDLSLNFESDIAKVIEDEVGRFSISLEKGMKQIEKIDSVDSKKAFDLYQTYGFPFEVTQEIFADKGQKIDKDKFQKELEMHQEKSRSASAGKFKGGLADSSEATKKLHTVTHLLHAALRSILGDHVSQKGSNITSDRLRFDFSHKEKLNEDEIKKVEVLINKEIDKDLEVTSETMTLDEAKDAGALAFFGHKYDELVKVYSIGKFSKEVCGGPHVKRLSEIKGHVRINKEESVSSGVRRIYAVIEK